ncbi:endonuclease/exonuclease/phosphatase family protein [Parerythrobacter jejuensis]|uniref:Endonuclease n=1 Tax=Parerythrobacter jejuensis TaxID=795812 RepID=A0A845AUC2_9SPHN|nr:endonuclease/exonuclease/phosphatase family protein [Parerythrobacter jejuensis]MXP32106.1 endonuclease [Parerythrobacter jejuensis]
MTLIHGVRWKLKASADHRRFVAERLLGLKQALGDEIHGSTDENSLRLATWNLMHFGSGGGYDRTVESMFYIAEIIDHFDLVALQEINRDLRKLEDLVDNYLGNDWDYLVTDTSGGHGDRKDAGNDERLAFLYRKSKVSFRKEVGEIVLPEGQEIAAPDADGTSRHVQFARTPFTVAFRAGWLKFKLCTVHIFYGDSSNSSAKMRQRRDEIRKIAEFLAERQKRERDAMIDSAREANWAAPEEGGWASNYILLGDFNIVSPEHETMEALEGEGFTVATKPLKSNLGNNKHYDQIAYRAAHPDFEVVQSGVFDMLQHVYRDVDAAHYVETVKVPKLLEKGRKGAKAEGYFKRYYRRHQMSDHKLLWSEISIDYSEDYLQAVINEE